MILGQFITRKLLLALGLVLLASHVLWAGSGELELLTEELPWAVIGTVYSPAPLDVRVTGRCPAGGVGFSVVSGVLPPGLKLSRLGYFSGVPARNGLFEFEVRAVNGCSWVTRSFALLVTERPRLKTAPDTLTVECLVGVNPPAASVHVTATWPLLEYEANVTFPAGGTHWLTAVAQHGMTSRESVPRKLTEIPSDEMTLRFNTSGLKAGRYEAQISISAWQASPVLVAVILNVKPGAAPTALDRDP